MTANALTQRCKGRNFDRIVVLVQDVFEKMAQYQTVEKATPGSLGMYDETTAPLYGAEGEALRYTERSASYFYANTELCFIEPGAGETLYRRFLDRFGEGLACVRERVDAAAFDALERAYREKGLIPVQRLEKGEERAFWLDLTEQLGILFEVTTGGTEEAPARLPERIAQINITTPDIRESMEQCVKLLEIGPWEVGRQCNAVVDRPAFRVNGELREAEFSFLLGILVCGNIEWEIIQPEKGPLVYYDFLARRRVGFHHILREISQSRWDARLAEYASDGALMACRGSLGPVDWCYVDTEKPLGFYTELRTDAVMEKLPDGYVQYFYPEN